MAAQWVCWVRGGGTVGCGYNGDPVRVRFLTDGYEYPVTKCPTPSTPI